MDGKYVQIFLPNDCSKSLGRVYGTSSQLITEPRLLTHARSNVVVYWSNTRQGGEAHIPVLHVVLSPTKVKLSVIEAIPLHRCYHSWRNRHIQ